MERIERARTSARMSQIVTHGNTVYLAGQVGEPHHDITEQTRDALAQIDMLLEEAGSSREKLLQVTIWLANMSDFAAMNEVWDAWVPTGHAPARACGEAKLADPALLVEVIACASR
ncbi:RidA family protein [Metapseudomonas lalkuanensis]|uniref:RidA family protein n=1 Tax=Metapseudomonas lalkuanensis TaxID=2604832 RepID=A0A5J6QN67_9GAMM|nr:RidA family protein [Pseudomonas lalkuanensis]QEY63235.1 RidA family protein [Pseudomonas lalkuanensis]